MMARVKIRPKAQIGLGAEILTTKGFQEQTIIAFHLTEGETPVEDINDFLDQGVPKSENVVHAKVLIIL